MNEPKKRKVMAEVPDDKEPKTELPNTSHHYAVKEALKQGPVSITDALGTQSFS
jgi:hypothetical protein